MPEKNNSKYQSFVTVTACQYSLKFVDEQLIIWNTF